MVRLNAHFDGKVIVPDEPVDLVPNQRLRVTIEPVTTAAPTDFRKLVGLAGNQATEPYDPRDEDQLWESGPLTDPTKER